MKFEDISFLSSLLLATSKQLFVEFKNKLLFLLKLVTKSSLVLVGN